MSVIRKAVVFCAALTLGAGFSGMQLEAKTAKKPTRVAGPAPANAPSSPAKEAAAPEAPKEKLTYSGPPVLDPGQFFGAAAMGYAAAKAAPEVMQHLFCYCGCDESDKHSALIDCYTSNHGMDCHICQEEAVLALRLYRDGATMAEIQRRVDADYSKQYPFEAKSDALKKYESTKGGMTAACTPGTTPGTADCPTPPAGTDKTAAGKAKLKPGMTAGNCCGEGHEQDKKR